MRGWKIDVDGVRGVLASVVRAGESLSRHERDVEGLLDDAPPALAPSTRVSGAVSGLLSVHVDDVAVAGERSRRVLDAASVATQGYVAADESMAADAQASAASVFGGR
ncbi:hypothetical protein GCM10025867_30970 [Frondihabitans sucicola]|uniref:ESX-1 secretion-associated protein n=1 Tax=Frondihabitans sucicola TaxID=1268041 RepID=A0ABN6Y1F6_9MICO|nr:DUF6507 family protein [Frondihabitans sucicola]BDZ50856.1 hypothetical protein GCM10025867_30970 [Frondihabitans sucicola]